MYLSGIHTFIRTLPKEWLPKVAQSTTHLAHVVAAYVTPFIATHIAPYVSNGITSVRTIVNIYMPSFNLSSRYISQLSHLKCLNSLSISSLQPVVKITGSFGRFLAPVWEILNNKMKSRAAALSPTCEDLQRKLNQEKDISVEIKENPEIENIEMFTDFMGKNYVCISPKLAEAAKDPKMRHAVLFLVRKEIAHAKNKDIIKMTVVLTIIAIANILLTPFIGGPLSIVAITINFIFLMLRPTLARRMESKAYNFAINRAIKNQSPEVQREILTDIAHLIAANIEVEQDVFKNLTLCGKVKYYVHRYFLFIMGEPPLLSDKAKLAKIRQRLTTKEPSLTRAEFKQRENSCCAISVNPDTVKQMSEKLLKHTFAKGHKFNFESSLQPLFGKREKHPLQLPLQFCQKSREIGVVS